MEPILKTFRYHVFLSFRGEDTRNNFTSQLYEALRRHNFEIFHDTLLTRGESIAHQLPEAIKESKIFVVVFSPNYADSKWCLNELSQMMDSVDMNIGHIILPVFLDVKKSDVGTQQGSYKKPFPTHDLKYPEDVQKWRKALSKAGELHGLHLQHDANGDEGRLVDQIVERIRKYLHEQDSNIADSMQPLVGIESRIAEVISLLSSGSNNDDDDDVRVVAICGPLGLGKTTIAKATYDRLAINFKAQYCCLILDVKSVFEESNGKVNLQKMLISNLIQKDESQIRIDSYHHGTGRIQKILKNQKVLLVLDDVDNDEQLKILGINRANFGSGSRIIVTTRDASFVGGVKPDATYEPRLFDETESLDMFSLNAFGQHQPKEGYEEVSRKAVCWGAGRPGVLNHAATHLRCYEVQYWECALEELMRNSSW